MKRPHIIREKDKLYKLLSIISDIYNEFGLEIKEGPNDTIILTLSEKNNKKDEKI